jgi:hypothetical protein
MTKEDIKFVDPLSILKSAFVMTIEDTDPTILADPTYETEIVPKTLAITFEIEQMPSNPENGETLFKLTLKNVDREIYRNSRLTISLADPAKFVSESTGEMVDGSFQTISTFMKPYNHKDHEISEQVFEATGNTYGYSILSILLVAKMLLAGFICFNPFMAIIIKNILVLEFCSILIMFNIEHSLKMRQMLTILYEIVQQELIPNFYDMNLAPFSPIYQFKGNISLLGVKSYMLENAGGELNFILLTFICWNIINFMTNKIA